MGILSQQGNFFIQSIQQNIRNFIFSVVYFILNKDLEKWMNSKYFYDLLDHIKHNGDGSPNYAVISITLGESEYSKFFVLDRFLFQFYLVNGFSGERSNELYALSLIPLNSYLANSVYYILPEVISFHNIPLNKSASIKLIESERGLINYLYQTFI